MTAKEQIISTSKEWINTKIDTLTANSPRMSVIAPRLKQGIDNWMYQNESKIDNMLLFITDKDGKLDIGDLFEEAAKVFEEMPIQTKNMFGLDLNIGKGAVELLLPDNLLINMLMGKTGSIKLTSADFMELKTMLMNKTV